MDDFNGIENFLLEILEYKEFSDIRYIFYNIRKSAVEYVATNRFTETFEFVSFIQDHIKNEIITKNISPENLLMYMIHNDSNGWCMHFILTRFKKKNNISFEQYNASYFSKDIVKNIDIDYNYLSLLTICFTIDHCLSRVIDVEYMIENEKIIYEHNSYNLTKINGAIFLNDGLIFDDKYYLYNILTNTTPLVFLDNMPSFARLINDNVNSGDILYRLDERLSFPKDEIISYSSLNFEKFHGPDFNFNNINLKDKKTIIVHIDDKTMDKLLMVIKKNYDINNEQFLHIEIETLPYIDQNNYHFNHVITTFLHGMYYSNKDKFTHIDYTKNQYNLIDYIKKYSESNNDIPIDYYTTKELHYKIWCIENSEYNKELWYKLMISSLPKKYQILLNEMLSFD